MGLLVTLCYRHADQHFFFFFLLWAVVVVVVVWVDRCVRGGGLGGFCGGGCGCWLVGLVDRCVCDGGSAWLFFFLCCGLW